MKKINLLVLPMMLALVGCGGRTSSATSSAATSSAAPSSQATSSAAASSQAASSQAASSQVASSEAASSQAASSAQESSADPSDDTFIVEAEFSPDIEYLDGNGFSGTATGANMVLEDTAGYGASHGYYLTYMYKTNNSVSYTIKSDKAVTGVTLVWRITGEFFNNQTYTATDCQVTVNNKLIAYQSITLDDIPSQASGDIRAFTDYTLSTTVSLKEGNNTLVYTTANSTALGGTMSATAPMLDCFKFSNLSGAVLEFTDAVDYYED